MTEELIRKLELDVAEHRIRIDSLEKLIAQQNRTLTTLSEQFTKLQNRLSIIGTAAVMVIAITSEQGGTIIRVIAGL